MTYEPQYSGMLVVVVVLLGTVVISRFIRESGLRHLSAEQKVTLVDAFSGQRKYSLLILIAVAIGAFLIQPLLVPVAILAYMIIGSVLTVRKLRRLQVPAAFLRTHLASSAVILLGLAASFTAFVWQTRY